MKAKILLTSKNSKLSKLIQKNIRYTKALDHSEYDLACVDGINKLCCLIRENSFDYVFHLASDFKKERSVNHLISCLNIELVCVSEIAREMKKGTLIVFNSVDTENEKFKRYDYSIAKDSLRAVLNTIKDENKDINIICLDLPKINKYNENKFIDNIKDILNL